MKIRILGAHNSETARSSCISILVDDRLAIEAGGLTSRLTVEEQENIDAIVISHNHMDHIRDIPAIALNSFQRGTSIDIYAMPYACEMIKKHLLNDEIFPEFHNIPAQKPTVCFLEMEPLGLQWVDGHAILPVPVNHRSEAVGFQISDKNGKTIFFSGDTGPDLAECWCHVSPGILIIDVTMPNQCEDFARLSGHLTPKLLEEELNGFRSQKGYLPYVMAIHMDIMREAEIRAELDSVGERLGIAINMAHEGMNFTV